MMINIAVMIGSLRKDSFNRKLAQALETLAAGKIHFTYIEIGDLPLFNQDIESPLPAPVARIKKDIENADAVLFVTPEYNRSIPGVLKNAIDWASRPYGQSSFSGKPAAICGTSPGAIGAAVAQNHLRSITSGFLDMPTLGLPEMYLTWKDGMISADGKIADEKTRAFLQGFVDRLESWTGIHSGASARKIQAA